ncbi:hypothetical protein [Burkholderia pseudomallei]|uniref:hypothetical protein n=1 Tax=Burkholderia pseudomallei TaxID=28450 RepID=UPI0015E327A5|nr:hypothetical protein [Burkholderia pseudomallei]
MVAYLASRRCIVKRVPVNVETVIAPFDFLSPLVEESVRHGDAALSGRVHAIHQLVELRFEVLVRTQRSYAPRLTEINRVLLPIDVDLKPPVLRSSSICSRENPMSTKAASSPFASALLAACMRAFAD